MARILRPGGRLILSASAVFSFHGGRDNYYHFTPAGLESVLGDDLDLVEMRGSTGPFETLGVLAQRIALQCDVFPPVRPFLDRLTTTIPRSDLHFSRQYDNMAKLEPVDPAVGVMPAALIVDVTARTIETQVAVIGSGPGGAEVAIQLARRGIRVTVLESGLDMFDPFANALNEAEYVGRQHRNADTPEQFQQYLPADYQGLNRVREFGGTGNTWTGKWRSFSAADVAPRAWVPHSGWPIDYGDLDAAYREVIAAYGLQLGADHPRDAALTRGARAFADAGFGVVEYYNQGKTYRSKDALLAAEG
ncbi:2-PD dehydrogenase), partial [Durusdinium trenchii]